MKTFGEKLKELMKLDNINTIKLSKMLNPPPTRQAIDYWLTLEYPPKKRYIKQLAKIFKCPEEYFYLDGKSLAYVDVVYNKKLTEIDDYKLLAELINNSQDFQTMHSIPDTIRELFEDKNMVDTLKITGEELQMLLTASHRHGDFLNKKFYIETLMDIRNLLIERIYPEFKKKK
jgi:transcriptional regulator with XRE-family HTH domain